MTSRMASRPRIPVIQSCTMATRPGSWLDHMCRLLATTGVSLPTFFTGLLLAYVFYFLLGLAPSPIGRIDDERRPLRRDHRGSRLDPEPVVGTWIAGTRLRFDVRVLRRALLDGGDLRIREELLLRRVLGALERRQRGETPDPLEVRLPRRPGRLRRVLRLN